MNKKQIIEGIKNISEPIAEEFGFELVDVEFLKEGSSHFLRVYLDKPGGINLDDCQLMSQTLSDKLDEKDPISVAYYLEVSSPGLDRPLKTDKDLNRNIGKEVEIKLYEPSDGKKILEGILESYNKEDINIKIESGDIMNIARKSVAVIKLAVKF